MTENYDGFGGSGIFFAFLIFALFAFGGNGGGWGCKNYNIYDLYYTLNMVRSDYYKDGQAPQYYADLAFDFLEDKDAPEGKAKRYYLAMHCAE